MKPLLYLPLLLLLIMGCSDRDDDLTNTLPEIVDFELGKSALSFDHEGTNREYLIYIPESIEGTTTAVPLLFSFHGLNGTAEGMYNLTRFHELAETYKFIAVYPQSLQIAGKNRWNDSNDYSNDKPKDQEFIKSLSDYLLKSLPVDADRIYLTGFSNGAHFSYHQFCQYPDYASVAGVGGGMKWVALNHCQVTTAKPILQIHGTEDLAVRYEEAQTTIDYWVVQNNNATKPVISAVPDTDPNDGSTVEKHVYNEGDNGMKVQHFKVIGGKHHWPGRHGNKDIDASEEIWKFFSGFDMNGPRSSGACRC